MAEAEDLRRLTLAARASFNRLKRLAEQTHRDLGVTAPMRAVLETLAEHGPQTAPQIARRKCVSRQHIQVNADALLALGLIETRSNPTHRRSPLLAATDAGGRTFGRILEREEAVLAEVAPALRATDVAVATTVLERLSQLLDARAETQADRASETNDEVAR